MCTLRKPEEYTKAMKHSSCILAFAFATALPGAARAEPVSISLQSSSGGFAEGESAAAASGFTINLGTLFMPSAGASASSALNLWSKLSSRGCA